MLRWRGIHIKKSPAESNCSPAPLISLRWSSCHAVRWCVYMCVCRKGNRRGGKRERSPEEYWSYGMVDITSLNKRLMPQAQRGWAEKEETDEEMEKHFSL